MTQSNRVSTDCCLYLLINRQGSPIFHDFNFSSAAQHQRNSVQTQSDPVLRTRRTSLHSDFEGGVEFAQIASSIYCPVMFRCLGTVPRHNLASVAFNSADPLNLRH